MKFDDLFEDSDREHNGCGKCLYCRMKDLMDDEDPRTLRVDLTFDEVAVLVGAVSFSMGADPPPGVVYAMKQVLKLFEDAFEQQYVGL